MDAYEFKFISVGYSSAGCGFVAVNLERMEGTPFVMLLSADDAERLCERLPIQIRIARQK